MMEEIMKRRTIAAVTVMVIAGLAQAVDSRLSAGAAQEGSSGQGTFTFALIGDMPYGAEGDAKFPNVIADINADRQLSFVVHDGDFKNGSSLCSDDVFCQPAGPVQPVRAALRVRAGRQRVDRLPSREQRRYDPLERLAFLRSALLSHDQSLGPQTMTLARQSADPQFCALPRERPLGRCRNVLFVGLHVVGSNNNLGRHPGRPMPSTRPATPPTWPGCSESFARAAARRESRP